MKYLVTTVILVGTTWGVSWALGYQPNQSKVADQQIIESQIQMIKMRDLQIRAHTAVEICTNGFVDKNNNIVYDSDGEACKQFRALVEELTSTMSITTTPIK